MGCAASSISNSLNARHVSLTVKPKSQDWFVGDTISGVVHLNTKNEIHFDHIKVQLIGEHTVEAEITVYDVDSIGGLAVESDTKEALKVVYVCPSEIKSLEAGGEADIPFSIDIPMNFSATTSKRIGKTAYQTSAVLRAYMDIPKAIDPTHEVTLNVAHDEKSWAAFDKPFNVEKEFNHISLFDDKNDKMTMNCSVNTRLISRGSQFTLEVGINNQSSKPILNLKILVYKRITITCCGQTFDTDETLYAVDMDTLGSDADLQGEEKEWVKQCGEDTRKLIIKMPTGPIGNTSQALDNGLVSVVYMAKLSLDLKLAVDPFIEFEVFAKG